MGTWHRSIVAVGVIDHTATLSARAWVNGGWAKPGMEVRMEDRHDWNGICGIWGNPGMGRFCNGRFAGLDGMEYGQRML